MKIGFDLSDYTWVNTDVLSEIMRSLAYSGHQIFVMGDNKSKDLMKMASYKMPAPNFYLQLSGVELDLDDITDDIAVIFSASDDGSFFMSVFNVEEDG